MNIFVWVLQGLAALLFGASGIMKTFMLDRISGDVASFGALPKKVWVGLGVLELVCVAGLIIPAALHWHSALTGVAAAVLSAEALLFVWVHVRYREAFPIALNVVLSVVLAFVAFDRLFLHPV